MLRSLFKRSTTYFVGLVIGRGLSTITWIILARTFSKSLTGDVIFYMTLLEVTTFVADFGLNQWYIKKIEHSDPKTLFQQTISARTTTLVFSMFITSLYLTLSQKFSAPITTMFVITLIPRALLSIGDGYFLEKKQSFRVALKMIIYMALFLVGFYTFRATADFLTIVQLYLVATAIAALWYFPWREIKDMQFLPYTKIKNILAGSSSYALLIITSFVYARGDSLVVGYTAGSVALGSYGLAYRYLDGVSLFPTAIIHNLFPISAKKTGVPWDVLKKMVTVLTLCGVIVGLTLFGLSGFLTTTILGAQYSDAAPVVQIFGIVSVLFFLNAPIATVVQSSDYVKKFLPWGIANTLANIILNIVFVPTGGIQAAAWVMLTTEVTGLLINLYFIKKIYNH